MFKNCSDLNIFEIRSVNAGKSYTVICKSTLLTQDIEKYTDHIMIHTVSNNVDVGDALELSRSWDRPLGNTWGQGATSNGLEA